MSSATDSDQGPAIKRTPFKADDTETRTLTTAGEGNSPSDQGGEEAKVNEETDVTGSDARTEIDQAGATTAQVGGDGTQGTDRRRSGFGNSIRDWLSRGALAALFLYPQTGTLGRQGAWEFEHPDLHTNRAARTGIWGLMDRPVDAILDLVDSRGDITVQCNPLLPCCPKSDDGRPYTSTWSLRAGQSHRVTTKEMGEDGTPLYRTWEIDHDGPVTAQSTVMLQLRSDTDATTVFTDLTIIPKSGSFTVPKSSGRARLISTDQSEPEGKSTEDQHSEDKGFKESRQ